MPGPNIYAINPGESEAAVRPAVITEVLSIRIRAMQLLNHAANVRRITGRFIRKGRRQPRLHLAPELQNVVPSYSAIRFIKELAQRCEQALELEFDMVPPAVGDRVNQEVQIASMP
jgi:hypothetical protein